MRAVHPIPWNVSHGIPTGMTFPWTSLAVHLGTMVALTMQRIFQTCGSKSVAVWKHCYRFTHAYFHTGWNNVSWGGIPPKIFKIIVILRFERRYPKENAVARLKSNISNPKKILGWLRHWAIVSRHHLSKMSEVNSRMWKSALTIVTWSEPLTICCHVTVIQARRQDLAAGGAKEQKEGPKTRSGGHFFEIQYWMYAATGGPNVKWGAPILKRVGGHHCPPPLATALLLCNEEQQ